MRCSALSSRKIGDAPSWEYQWTAAHWEFLCSDCSNLNLMRWRILVIVSFLGINSDKITILGTKIIKLTWEIILMKMKMSARWRHCSKIFKTNLKIHISQLLNCPQGCRGCQENRKDLTGYDGDIPACIPEKYC